MDIENFMDKSIEQSFSQMIIEEEKTPDRNL